MDATIAMSNAGTNIADWREDIRARIRQADERIDRNYDRGALTREEARRLSHELRTILAKIDHMKQDGRISPRERERIIDDLDRLDRHISREKNDDDRRDRRW